MQKTTKSRLTAYTLAAGVALIASSSLAGGADAQTLPGGTKTAQLGGGDSVTIKLFDESATVKRAVTSVPTSREVWVSGKVRVTTSGDVKGGNVTAGYVVGCQLNTGAKGGGSGGLGTSFDPSALPKQQLPFTPPKPLDGTGGSGTVAIAPGQAAYVPVIRTSINGNAVDSFSFRDKSGGVTYSQERIGVDGCAGFAEARAMVRVKVATDTFKGNVTLYGKPFSLG